MYNLIAEHWAEWDYKDKKAADSKAKQKEILIKDYTAKVSREAQQRREDAGAPPLDLS